MEIVEKPYNYKEEITKLITVTKIRIADKPISFNMTMAPDIPYELIGDKVHVKQIVNNLVTNAIKYTEKGSIALNIRCINQKDVSNLIITVRDTGRGIKTDHINKLFTKFERLDIEKNTTTEGTELGLAITKSLIEMMGGKINVQSQFGTGSIFMAQIPQKISKMSEPIKDTNVQVHEVKPDNYGNKKILIVDDNILNIKVARKALASFNFEIDECYDGLQCLDRVKNGNEYNLILMDIMMPNMNGELALEKLKENSNFKIPVIALTADAVNGAKEKYISEGFIDYIAKPFNHEQIKEKLNNIFASNITEEASNADKWKDVPVYVVADGSINK